MRQETYLLVGEKYDVWIPVDSFYSFSRGKKQAGWKLMLITVVTKEKRGVGKDMAESERSSRALVSEPRGMFQSSPE